jgi:hypothetical protein
MWKTISLPPSLSARGALCAVEFLHELPQRIGEGTRVTGDRPLVAERPGLAGYLQRHLDWAVGALRPGDNSLEAQPGAVGDDPADGLVILVTAVDGKAPAQRRCHPIRGPAGPARKPTGDHELRFIHLGLQ